MNNCTLWLEGWWSHCCQAHDASYAAQSGRSAADADLFACVASSLPAAFIDNPLMSTIAGTASLAIGVGMWAAVRMFGRRFYRR